MKKYYITYGGLHFLLHHSDMWEACRIAMGNFFDKSSSYIDSVPSNFRVSERGFDKHGDDLIVPLNELLEV